MNKKKKSVALVLLLGFCLIFFTCEVISTVSVCNQVENAMLNKMIDYYDRDMITEEEKRQFAVRECEYIGLSHEEYRANIKSEFNYGLNCYEDEEILATVKPKFTVYGFGKKRVWFTFAFKIVDKDGNIRMEEADMNSSVDFSLVDGKWESILVTQYHFKIYFRDLFPK